jgi:hypothetical protein
MSTGEQGPLARARRLVSDVRSYRWNRGSHVSTESPIVIGGCGRSGTTLMRVILDSHSQIACGPESNVFPSPNRLNPGSVGARKLARKFDLEPSEMDDILRASSSRAEFADRFFDAYRRHAGKPLWADKTPRNVQVLPYILEHFPKARFVHVIRDGRDVVCSLRTHPRHRVVDGRVVELDTWNPIEPCVERWLKDVGDGLAFRGDPRYYELRYEDLVLDTEYALRGLFDFLELPWEPAVMSFHEVASASRDPMKFAQNPEATKPLRASSIGRWERDLSEEDLAYVLREAGPLLRDLGYVAAS